MRRGVHEPGEGGIRGGLADLVDALRAHADDYDMRVQKALAG